jgi:hypothetical protein
MQVGDLVTKHFDAEEVDLLGIVIAVEEDQYIKVSWNRGYGIFWTLMKTARVVK